MKGRSLAPRSLSGNKQKKEHARRAAINSWNKTIYQISDTYFRHTDKEKTRHPELLVSKNILD